MAQRTSLSTLVCRPASRTNPLETSIRTSHRIPRRLQYRCRRWVAQRSLSVCQASATSRPETIPFSTKVSVHSTLWSCCRLRDANLSSRAMRLTGARYRNCHRRSVNYELAWRLSKRSSREAVSRAPRISDGACRWRWASLPRLGTDAGSLPRLPSGAWRCKMGHRCRTRDVHGRTARAASRAHAWDSVRGH